MKISNNKKTFKTHIYKNVFIYLILIIITPIFTSWLIDLKNKPKKEEIFSIFISESLKNNNEKNLYNNVRALLANDIKLLQIFSFDTKDRYFETFYQVHGPEESDLIILSSTALRERDSHIKTSMILINESIQKDNDYLIDGKHYGIKIYDKDTKNGFIIDYIDFKEGEDYYLFISKKSAHLEGTLSEYVNKIVSWIFNEK